MRSDVRRYRTTPFVPVSRRCLRFPEIGGRYDSFLACNRPSGHRGPHQHWNEVWMYLVKEWRR